MAHKLDSKETIVVYVKESRAKPPFFTHEKKQKYTLINFNKVMTGQPFEEYAHPIKITVEYNPVLDK